MLEKLNLRMEYKIGTDARCAVIGYELGDGHRRTACSQRPARRVAMSAIPRCSNRCARTAATPLSERSGKFDRNSIAPSSDLDAVVRDADIVILATPSAYLRDFLAPLTVPLRDKFVVSAIRGHRPGRLPDRRGVHPRPYGLSL